MAQVSELRFPDSLAECPRCGAEVQFRRSPDPVIDSCGFETYTLVCAACGQTFSGIIDPGDDEFLPHTT
jgi:transcription elongation factor Elf1